MEITTAFQRMMAEGMQRYLTFVNMPSRTDVTGLGETLARLLARTLGPSVVRPLRLSTESKSRLGYNLLAAVNGGRLKMYAADGSAEWAEFWRQMELARVSYRSGRTMNFFVDPASGHDDYLMSLALVARGRSAIRQSLRQAQARQ